MYNNIVFEEKVRCLEMSFGLRLDYLNFRLLSSVFFGVNKYLFWWIVLKVFFFFGVFWVFLGDLLVFWDCEWWWFVKLIVRFFFVCLEILIVEGFKYFEGIFLKKNVFFGLNWNWLVKKKDLSRFCFIIKFY